MSLDTLASQMDEMKNELKQLKQVRRDVKELRKSQQEFKQIKKSQQDIKQLIRALARNTTSISAKVSQILAKNKPIRRRNTLHSQSIRPDNSMSYGIYNSFHIMKKINLDMMDNRHQISVNDLSIRKSIEEELPPEGKSPASQLNFMKTTKNIN